MSSAGGGARGGAYCGAALQWGARCGLHLVVYPMFCQCFCFSLLLKSARCSIESRVQCAGEGDGGGAALGGELAVGVHFGGLCLVMPFFFCFSLFLPCYAWFHFALADHGLGCVSSMFWLFQPLNAGLFIWLCALILSWFQERQSICGAAAFLRVL